MESTFKHSAAGQIGCAVFGTPNGREVVAQTGISVAHQDDWVAQAAHAIEFDFATDTLVMQRIGLADATIFWFGMFRQASEINFNRGGYVGFGVWAVNHRLDGEKLLRTLTLAAAQIRDVAVTDGKFHTSIRSIADNFASDAPSYGAMLKSARALTGSISTAEMIQQPRVLDMRGCSDAWCAQVINLFQSESGPYTGEALALARSDAVVESAARLRLWPVLSPIDWLAAPSSSLVQGLRTQLQEATAEIMQRKSMLSDLSKRLSAAEEKSQSLAAMRQQLVDLQAVADQERLAAHQAKLELDNLQHYAEDELEKLGQRMRSAERLANDRAMELERLSCELQAIKSAPSPGISGQRQLGSASSDLKNLERQLEIKKEQCDQWSIRYTEICEKNRALEDRLDELAEEQNGDFVADHGIQKNGVKSVFRQRVAMGSGWLAAIVLAVLLIFNVGNHLEMMKSELQIKSERAQLNSEIDRLREDFDRMKYALDKVRQAEQGAVKERDALQAQLRALLAKQK
jgi:hypothetical protein